MLRRIAEHRDSKFAFVQTQNKSPGPHTKIRLQDAVELLWHGRLCGHDLVSLRYQGTEERRCTEKQEYAVHLPQQISMANGSNYWEVVT